MRTFTIEGMRDGRACRPTSYHGGELLPASIHSAESSELTYAHTTSWGMSTARSARSSWPTATKALSCCRGWRPTRSWWRPSAEPTRRTGPRLLETWSPAEPRRPTHLDDWPQLSLFVQPLEMCGPGAPGSGPHLDAGALRWPAAWAGKEQVPLTSIAQQLPVVLDELQQALLRRAIEFRDTNTHTVEDWDAFTETVTTGWARAFHCGQEDCEDDIKASTAATSRCVPLDAPAENGACVRCGKPSAYDKRVIFGRAY